MSHASERPDTSIQTASSLLHLIHAEHEKLLASIDGLSVSELCSEPVIGDWSVKDVLAHLAAWEQRLLQRVAGTPEDGAGLGTPHYNEQTYQKNRDRSWQSVKRNFTITHEQVVTLAESLSDADVKHWWTSFKFNTYNHYKWASTQIRRWRKQRSVK